jgi:hypothetical protein
MPLIEDPAQCENDETFSMICLPPEDAEPVMRDKCFHKAFMQDFKREMMVDDLQKKDVCHLARLEPIKLYQSLPGSKYASRKFSPYKSKRQAKPLTPMSSEVLAAKIRHRDRVVAELATTTDENERKLLQQKIAGLNRAIQQFRKVSPKNKKIDYETYVPYQTTYPMFPTRTASKSKSPIRVTEKVRMEMLAALHRKRDQLQSQLSALDSDDADSRPTLRAKLADVEKKLGLYKSYPSKGEGKKASVSMSAPMDMPIAMPVPMPTAMPMPMSTAMPVPTAMQVPSKLKSHTPLPRPAKTMEQVVKLNRTAQLRLAQATLRKSFGPGRRVGGTRTRKHKTRKHKRRQHRK